MTPTFVVMFFVMMSLHVICFGDVGAARGAGPKDGPKNIGPKDDSADAKPKPKPKPRPEPETWCAEVLMYDKFGDGEL